MTSSTSSSEKQTPTATMDLPDRRSQWVQLRKLILRILLPLLLLTTVFALALDWFVSKKLISQTSTHGAAKLFRIKESRPDEIPIIGSSRALCTYIPDSIGPNFYNYGINGIGYAVMDIFLKQELEQTEKTSPIVLNFDFSMFGDQMGDRNSYLPHSQIPEVKALLDHHDFYSSHMRIPGIRYYGAIDAFIKDRLNESLMLTKAVNKGAAIEKAVSDPSQMAILIQKRKDSIERFLPETRLIDTLIHRIQTHPKRMFFIAVAPYHSSFFESLPNADFDRAKQVLDRIDVIPNARVIFFDTRQWPDSYFFNTSHVSQLGAIQTSKMLKDSLFDSKSTTNNGE